MKSRHFILSFIFLLCNSFAFASEPAPENNRYPQNVEEALAATYKILRIDKHGNGSGVGSGWLVDVSAYGLSGCYIVSNDHVATTETKDGKREIARIQVVQYKTSGNRSWQETHLATVVYRDAPPVDIAILKIDNCDGVKPFKLRLNAAKSGMDVYALGSPHGLEQTVTKGIVSYPSRLTNYGRKPQVYVQTDVDINPGNSGGPLVHAETFEVIAMNTLIHGRSLNVGVNVISTGIGFSVRAVNINRAFKDYVAAGQPSHPSFGFMSEPMSDDYVSLLGYPTRLYNDGCRGMYVKKVLSYMSQNGLKEDDVLFAVNGNCINTSEGLFSFLESTNALEVSVFQVWRERRFLTLHVQPKETYKPRPLEDLPYSDAEMRYAGLLGFEISQSTDYPTDRPVITRVYAYSDAFWNQMLWVYKKPKMSGLLPQRGVKIKPNLSNGIENVRPIISPDGGRLMSFHEIESVMDTSGRKLLGLITQQSLEGFAKVAKQGGYKIVIKTRFVVLRSSGFISGNWSEDEDLSRSRTVFIEPKAYQLH